jgi:hypothetical protein
LANTRFVTANGLTFIAKNPLKIPAWLPDNPSEIKAKFYAAETDEEGIIMWTRGNIPKNTRLTIRNLDNSYYFGQIWAETIEDFTWWSSTALWTISDNDRIFLDQKIRKSVYADKLNIVSKEFQVKDTLILTFDQLVTTVFNKLTVNGKIWERATSLKGEADVTFSFFYLKRPDIVAAFTQYVKERQSDSIELISINPNSLVFIHDANQDFAWIEDGDVFMIPTRVTIFQGYDFKRDVKGILPSIKTNVSWKTVEEARKIILQYPEVSSVKINLWLLQSDVLPNVKSRIKVKVEY